jgi:hypothetical protein
MANSPFADGHEKATEFKNASVSVTIYKFEAY